MIHHNKDMVLESGILGSILEHGIFDKIVGVIVEDDFSTQDGKFIFSAMQKLHLSGVHIDLFSTHAEIIASGNNIEIAELFEVQKSSWGVDGLVSCAKTLARQSFLKRLKIAAENILNLSQTSITVTDTANDVLRVAENILAAIPLPVFDYRPTGWQHIQVAVQPVLDAAELKENQGGCDFSGLSTGITLLDAQLGGMQPGQLIVVGARPGMGKTALVLNIAENVAIREKLHTLFFSLEMSAAELALRSLAALARVPSKALSTGSMGGSHQDYWGRVVEAVELFGQANLWIDDQPARSLSDIARSCRKKMTKDGQISCIIIDYLQLMDMGESNKFNESQSISKITSALKSLAKELECPIILLSQLNRAVEDRVDKRPNMSDLRGSGSIEQDADSVIFIYRDEYYSRENSKSPGVAELIVAKNRSGPTGVVKVGFDSTLTKFHNI
jgi:replicative DNA helicase